MWMCSPRRGLSVGMDTNACTVCDMRWGAADLARWNVAPHRESGRAHYISMLLGGNDFPGALAVTMAWAAASPAAAPDVSVLAGHALISERRSSAASWPRSAPRCGAGWRCGARRVPQSCCQQWGCPSKLLRHSPDSVASPRCGCICARPPGRCLPVIAGRCTASGFRRRMTQPRAIDWLMFSDWRIWSRRCATVDLPGRASCRKEACSGGAYASHVFRLVTDQFDYQLLTV